MRRTLSDRDLRGAVVLAVATVLLAVGCADDGDDATPTTSSAPRPAEDARYECVDAPGDVEDVNAPAGETAFAEPAGIDLLEATVERTDTTVDATFTVAGDIDGTTTLPTFVLFRGTAAATQGSFELQALRDSGGGWVLYVIDYATSVGERDRLDDVAVEVEGDTLSFSAPLAVLPPLGATVGWGFGTRDGDRPTVEELDTTTTSGAPTPPTDPPDRVARLDVCTPFDDTETSSLPSDDTPLDEVPETTVEGGTGTTADDAPVDEVPETTVEGGTGTTAGG